MKRNSSRDLLKKLKNHDIKELFPLVVLSLSVILLTATLFVLGQIYLKDEPEFIPSEVRGKVREGIKNGVASPLAAVIPAVGNPFFNSAFTYKNNDAFTHSNNFISPDPAEPDKWKIYQNDELGFKLKIPEDYVYSKNESVENFYESSGSGRGFSIYAYDETALSATDWWVSSGVNLPSEFEPAVSLKLSGMQVYYYRGTSGLEEKHYVLKINDTLLDVVFLGVDSDFSEEIISSIN